MLHGLGVTDSWNWNDPSWSVSVEFFASIIFIPLLLRVKSNITLFIIASFSLCLVLGKHSTLMAATDVNLFVLSSGMLKCLGGMAIGMAVFNLVCESKPDQYFHNKLTLNICEYTCFIFICFFIYTVKPVRGYDVLVIISMAILIYTTTKYNSMLSKVLGSKIISYFGKISFSIYLIHTPLIVLLGSFKHFNSQNIYLQSLIFALITLLSSHYLYSRFEMPIYSKYRRITDSKFKSSRIITTS
jgi:peptidoglycan/LPS O-acetylase OafA/YrhL